MTKHISLTVWEDVEFERLGLYVVAVGSEFDGPFYSMNRRANEPNGICITIPDIDRSDLAELKSVSDIPIGIAQQAVNLAVWQAEHLQTEQLRNALEKADEITLEEYRKYLLRRASELRTKNPPVAEAYSKLGTKRFLCEPHRPKKQKK